LKTLARIAYTKRRFVLLGWIGLIVGLFALSSAFAGEFRTEFELPESESAQALKLLEDRGNETRGGFTGQFVFSAEQGVNDPGVRRAMEQFFADVTAVVEGEEIVSPYEPGNEYQISGDGRIAYAEFSLSNRSQEQFIIDAEAIRDVWEEVGHPGLTIELGGDLFAEFSEFSSEFIGLIAAVIILIIAFGSLLAMGLPIMTALFGIGCGVALIGLVTRVLAVPDFTTQIAAMIGIGVGIDYSLLVVTRYRQGLHDGLEPREAVSLAVDTAGRAVVFAGLTVVISLMGMFMMNMDFMRSLAVGAVLAVLMTMLASITLLPALLGFAGKNIDRLGLPHKAAAAEGDISRTFWYRWSRFIQRNPWPALIGSTAILVLLAAPVFSLRLGFADSGNRAETDTTRRAYDLLSEAFGPGFNLPFLLVVDVPNGAADMTRLGQLTSAVQNTDGVASVAEPVLLQDANIALINVFASTAPQDRETTELVHRLRNETVPPVAASTGLTIYTSGGPPIVVDFSDYIERRLPVFIGAVLLLSFVLLLLVFHSVVVPLKAVAMNLLSIGAAFGAMVAVFQWGIGASLIGIGREGPIEAWGPMIMFAIVFGLSMDYEVFLLTRVREEFDRTGDNSRAVADGLAATGRVISAAAAIMVCVFGAFIFSDERALKMIGFGLAFAIFIDATIVRLMLVPSAMELMGRANWWAPEWLVRYLPTIRVDSIEKPRQEPLTVEPAPIAGGSE
jgi:putative drug exporter of the RND superfamily